MRLRGGVECRVVKGERRGEGAGVFEEKIGREEIRRAIGKIKDGKAWGIDGIPGEVWKYGGRMLRNGYGTFAIEYGEERPEEWKKGVIVPIVKRGEGERVEEYKGITLLTITYKIKK